MIALSAPLSAIIPVRVACYDMSGVSVIVPSNYNFSRYDIPLAFRPDWTIHNRPNKIALSTLK